MSEQYINLAQELIVNEAIEMKIREKIARKRDGGRNWKNLPSGFELDAVRAAFQDIKGYFNKSEIGNRIKASKAQTFEELYKYIK